MLGYYIIFVVYFGLGVLIMYTFSWTFMKWFNKWINCPDFGSASCFGASLIMRVSLSLVILYFIMLLLMLPKDDFSYGANKTCWILKYLLPFGLVFAFFFVGNNFFNGYAIFCKYAGIVYLIIQDLAFNEYFIRFSNSFIVKARENVCYTVLYWLFCMILIGVAILLIALDFTYNWACPVGKAFTIITIIVNVANLGLTFLNTRNDVNILSTSLYNCYITYYLYSGMSANTDLSCTSLSVSSNWILSEILINVFIITIIFLLMTYSREMPVFHIKTAEEGRTTAEFFANPELRDNTLQYETTALRGTNATEVGDAQDHLEYRTLKFVWLFLCYVFLSMHFLTIITNFGTVSIYQNESWYLENNQSGFGIKIFNGLLATLLYLWILLAPIICKNRDFGYNTDPREVPVPARQPEPSAGPDPMAPRSMNPSQAAQA